MSQSILSVLLILLSARREAGKIVTLFSSLSYQMITYCMPNKKTFHLDTVGSVLSRSVTAWYGSCSSNDHRTLRSEIRCTQQITRTKLPTLQDMYIWLHRSKTCSIIKYTTQAINSSSDCIQVDASRVWGWGLTDWGEARTPRPIESLILTT